MFCFLYPQFQQQRRLVYFRAQVNTTQLTIFGSCKKVISKCKVDTLYYLYVSEESDKVRSSEGAEKEKLEKELEEHHKLAESAFTMRRDDKARAVRSWVGKPRPVGSSGVKHRSKDAVDMITYDFQQNLETPNLQHNDMFYKRQLWTYNFGIHDCVSNQGYMFMWDETTAKRGSVEVANCLYNFLTEFNTGAR